MTAPSNKPLAQLDPRWRTEVLDYFTKNDYAEALPRAQQYRLELPNRPEILANLSDRNWLNIDHVIASSAYGVAQADKTAGPAMLAEFLSAFDRYLACLGGADKRGIDPRQTERLLEDALDLLLGYQQEDVLTHIDKWVRKLVDAWDERVALPVLLKKVFDERIHPGRPQNLRILGEVYLRLAAGYGDHYRTERAAVMNLFSDLSYFEGTEEGENQALVWVERALDVNPDDQFAQQRRRDITRSRATREQIRRYNHDANNEIGGLKSNLDRLRQTLQQSIPGSAVRESTLQLLQRIDNALRRMGGIRRFLQEEQPTFQRNVDIHRELTELGASYEQLNLVFEPDVSQPWETDPDYLRLAIDNLFRNAAEAYARQRIPLAERQTMVSLSSHDGKLLIRVRDSAGGIDPHLGERVFEPYVSSKGIKKETGLGLYTAREAIRKLDGTLELACEQPSNGAEFVIRLP